MHVDTLTVSVNKKTGDIRTEVKNINISDPDDDAKTAFNIEDNFDKKAFSYLINEFGITFQNCNFNNPIVEKYDKWSSTWRQSYTDALEWRTNLDRFTYIRHNEWIDVYVDKIRDIVFAHRDPKTEGVVEFIERSAKIREARRISEHLNSIGRSYLQTKVEVDGSIMLDK